MSVSITVILTHDFIEPKTPVPEKREPTLPALERPVI